MIETIILIEGNNIEQEDLRRLGLSNAMQLVGDNYPKFGTILHIAANTTDDLSNALLEFSKVSGVSRVTTLALHNS